MKAKFSVNDHGAVIQAIEHCRVVRRKAYLPDVVVWVHHGDVCWLHRRTGTQGRAPMVRHGQLTHERRYPEWWHPEYGIEEDEEDARELAVDDCFECSSDFSAEVRTDRGFVKAERVPTGVRWQVNIQGGALCIATGFTTNR
jgi:hypothetical protein